MRAVTIISAALAAGITSATTPSRTTVELPARADALPAVSASGNAFYANGKRFYMRGIDYQPGGSAANLDPLADPKICKRDVEKFRELGVNTIRVYAVDNAKDHKECMQALNDAGIYLVLDVNNPQYSINRKKPAPSYNEVYLQSVFAVVDEFQKYSNTLAFFSGNEVINDEEGTTRSAPYVKAVTRDMRQYIRNRKYRNIPVGYSAADVSGNRMQTAHYFNCGSEDERSDFFAFNDYSWCSPSSFTISNWDVKVRNFTGYGLPIFLSEWGCITNSRDFSELSALMSDQMTGVYSGGLMYEYSLEENKFGIIDLTKNPISELPEFQKMVSAMSKYPAPTGAGGAASTTNSVACPTTDGVWDLGSWGPTALPAIPEGAKKYMTAGAGKGPGLNGDGSQNSGQDVHTTASAGSGQPTTTEKPGGNGNAAGHMDASIFAVTGAAAFCALIGTLLL